MYFSPNLLAMAEDQVVSFSKFIMRPDQERDFKHQLKKLNGRQETDDDDDDEEDELYSQAMYMQNANTDAEDNMFVGEEEDNDGVYLSDGSEAEMQTQTEQRPENEDVAKKPTSSPKSEEIKQHANESIEPNETQSQISHGMADREGQTAGDSGDEQLPPQMQDHRQHLAEEENEEIPESDDKVAEDIPDADPPAPMEAPNEVATMAQEPPPDDPNQTNHAQNKGESQTLPPLCSPKNLQKALKRSKAQATAINLSLALKPISNSFPQRIGLRAEPEDTESHDPFVQLVKRSKADTPQHLKTTWNAAQQFEFCRQYWQLRLQSHSLDTTS
eukprot:TRINITY_DN7678_c0_g2_i2.p1 TRINITY_DN7678_c0_g2~~TRINITY_DN7678_c0_g2_i2.p1  ORF type:complete len:330 (+),score=52.92 TRINITY_DN7678_c0_g2_i2:52-1041(+)